MKIDINEEEWEFLKRIVTRAYLFSQRQFISGADKFDGLKAKVLLEKFGDRFEKESQEVSE